MSRELDRRNFSTDAAPPQRREGLQRVAREVSEALPADHEVRVTKFDRTTGVPRVVSSVAAPPEEANFVERAVDHVQTIAPVFGLVATKPEFIPDTEVQRTSSGGAAVQLQQQHLGIPLFQATETVRFNPDGSVRDTKGSSSPVEESVDREPKLNAEEAVRRAAEHVASPDGDEDVEVDEFGEKAEPAHVDLAGFEPKAVSVVEGSPARETTLVGEPFEGDIRAGLMWFPMGENLVLTWETLLTFPQFLARYRTLVEADSGEVLYCRQLVRSIAARGNVYRRDGATERQMTEFPMAPNAYGIEPRGALPDQWPDVWVTD